MEREWIIEQTLSDSDFQTSRDYVLHSTERYLTQYRNRLEQVRSELERLRPWPTASNRRVQILENERDSLQYVIKTLGKMRGDAAFAAHKRDWVPVYLFRHTSMGAWDYTWIECKLYDVMQMGTHKTTLERCVELSQEIASILKGRQLRIRNVYTGETIPCELFG